jgi:hypothetical protein
LFLIIRTAAAPLAFASAVQERIRGIDAHQPMSDVRTMEDARAATCRGSLSRSLASSH